MLVYTTEIPHVIIVISNSPVVVLKKLVPTEAVTTQPSTVSRHLGVSTMLRQRPNQILKFSFRRNEVNDYHI